MISIINKGAPNKREEKDVGGLRNYEVRINNQLICTFKHYRRDGLAKCLLKAAAMVDAQTAEKAKLLERIDRCLMSQTHKER